MRFYSQNEVEHISRRVYTAYKKTAGYSEAPERVIPEQLADILGLTFDYRHLSKDRLTLGLTSFEDGDGVEVFDSPDEEFYVLDGKTALIEENLQSDDAMLGRCNFTKTHEVCHHILHLLYPQEFGSGTASRRILHYRLGGTQTGEVARHERLVDIVTSAVLMPEELVRKNMFLFSLPERIDILNRLIANGDYQKFCSMSECMGVSKQALAIRMKNLSLLGKDYLKNPYEMLNIYMEDNELG